MYPPQGVVALWPTVEGTDATCLFALWPWSSDSPAQSNVGKILKALLNLNRSSNLKPSYQHWKSQCSPYRTRRPDNTRKLKIAQTQEEARAP